MHVFIGMSGQSLELYNLVVKNIDEEATLPGFTSCLHYTYVKIKFSCISQKVKENHELSKKIFTIYFILEEIINSRMICSHQ